MKTKFEAQILDITEKPEYEKYLYKCLAPMPFRRYRKRYEYLVRALPRGFRKKLMIYEGDVVGAIEYAPADVSNFTIEGNGVVVMNCIWVLRKAKGHDFGKQLVTDMLKSEKQATCFATVALENHWSPWMRKDQIERLGFKALDSFEVRHRTKNTSQCFAIYLMWLPTVKKAKPPRWSKKQLLRGVDFCMGHPLYHPENMKLIEIYERC